MDPSVANFKNFKSAISFSFFIMSDKQSPEVRLNLQYPTFLNGAYRNVLLCADRVVDKKKKN